MPHAGADNSRILGVGAAAYAAHGLRTPQTITHASHCRGTRGVGRLQWLAWTARQPSRGHAEACGKPAGATPDRALALARPPAPTPGPWDRELSATMLDPYRQRLAPACDAALQHKRGATCRSDALVMKCRRILRSPETMQFSQNVLH